jgi:hypothetical protein
MTKVRDKDIISFMTKQGASLEDSMKKDILVLIVKSKEDAMIIDNYKMLYAKVISVNHFELKTQFGK